MTNVLSDGTTPAAADRTSRFDDKSLLGLSVGFAAALAAGTLCSWAKLPESVTASATAFAVAVPAAVDLHLKKRSRDRAVDAERVRNGDLCRPVGLVVAVLAAAILLLDSAIGVAVAGFFSLSQSDVISPWTESVLAPAVLFLLPAAFGVNVFLGVAYASHHFGKHPYLWATATVVLCLLLRMLVVWAALGHSETEFMGFSVSSTMVMLTVLHLGLFALAMSGVWYGRRHHTEFLARKLSRLEQPDR